MNRLSQNSPFLLIDISVTILLGSCRSDKPQTDNKLEKQQMEHPEKLFNKFFFYSKF